MKTTTSIVAVTQIEAGSGMHKLEGSHKKVNRCILGRAFIW